MQRTKTLDEYTKPRLIVLPITYCMSSFNPYLLITPAGLSFLGLALLATWKFDRQQRHLLYMGTGIVFSSVALGVQSVLPSELIAPYSPHTAVLYLLGATLIGLSIAHHFGGRYPATPALLVSSATLCAVYYFSHVQEMLSARALVLSAALSFLEILPLFHGASRHRAKNDLDRVLYWTYLVFCVYTLLRALSIVALQSDEPQDLDLTQTPYWFITMLGSILSCLAIAALLLASSIQNVLHKLNVERSLDPLTQLLNRRAFHEAVQAHTTHHNTASACVLMCDIDYFKRINDQWGHSYGDDVLCAVAESLCQSTRQYDLVCRFGGEEFVLLLSRSNLEGASQITQRIQSSLQSEPLRLPDQRSITLSMGLTTWQPPRAHRPSHTARRRCPLPRQASRAQLHPDGLAN